MAPGTNPVPCSEMNVFPSKEVDGGRGSGDRDFFFFLIISDSQTQKPQSPWKLLYLTLMHVTAKLRKTGRKA